MKTTLAKRICSLVLVIAMMLTVFPATVFAEETDITDADVEENMGETTETEDAEGGIPDDDLDDEDDDYSSAVDAASADDLAEALELGATAIRITADFELDRTFYIAGDTIIFTEEAHTLTRASDFGGDIFVVGESSDGVACENAFLQFGHEESDALDMLVIDGNGANMTVDVTGTVIFACNDSKVSLYDNLTIKNCVKTGNEKTLNEIYGLSYTDYIGGAVAIVVGSTMNIYGGTYSDNSVNDEGEDGSLTSTYGGAFYFFGPANIYGGTFKNNHAYRGGAFYAYRALNIYGATVSGNTASTNGGAIYMPASTLCYLNVEGGGDDAETPIIFRNNSAELYGGALYCQGVSVNISDATFEGNSSVSHGGAAYVSISSESEEDIKFTAANTEFNNNTTDYNGGALYLTGTAAYFEDVTFKDNYAKATANSSGSRYGGGAIYSTGSYLEINGGTFKDNKSDYNGGAIALYSSSKAVMNKITASGNTAEGAGGFVCANKSEVNIYNSAVKQNSATASGGAFSLTNYAFLNAYVTTFESNTSGNNGGALYVYTEAVDSLLHSCVFIENTAGNFGGAMYVSKASILTAYNTSAKQNSAVSGGFMYETTTGTTVTVNGITLSGNTASTAGPIIYGNTTNAVLKLNKTTYVDLDATAALDDEYFASAIANKLTVEEIADEVPGYIDYGADEVTPPEAIINPNVTNVVELQAALAAGVPEIYIISDFELDRTFYVTSNTTIYGSGVRTLTRKAAFGGDIFVVGEGADGELCEESVTLTVKGLDDESALTIDGNSQNMTVDVTGSVFFVCANAKISLHDGLTVTNCKKVGNEKTLNEAYGLSYTERIGGAVAVIAADGMMDIYGGTYSNNTVNDEADDGSLVSTQGGAFYSFGTSSIYGGTFENNHAQRGGAFYNYRTMHIYNAEIIGNTASDLGGAVYMAASVHCNLYIGENTNLAESLVTFKNNTSASHGGAIYCQGAITQIEDAVFIGNTSGAHGGAIYTNADSSGEDDVKLVIKDSTFEENVTVYSGGAVYMTGTRVRFEHVTFDSNIANAVANSSGNRYGGGAIYSTGSVFEIVGARFTNNVSDYNGGAIAMYSSSSATMHNVTAIGNTAGNGGGAIYCNSAVDIYNSTFNGNKSTGNGGAIALPENASANVYATKFIENTSGTNGGAMYVYTGALNSLVHSCEFTKNVSANYGGALYVSKASLLSLLNTTAKENSAAKGGFMYETTTGTTVTLNGITLSGNTATDGGPIIWGNTTNATLKLNKTNYVDLDTAVLDDAYFAAAVVNKLTVEDITDAVEDYDDYGNETYESMKEAVCVSSADELEAAINAGEKYIRIVSDFELDRTFYISSDITIFTTVPYRLTRASDFGGDIFVIGENKDGTSALLEHTNSKLTLGNPESESENLLIIDGNSKNMTVSVVGTVLFICNSGEAAVYSNVTVVDSHKDGNERTYDEKYIFSRPNRIGGSVSIIESGTLNIYGGNFVNNSVNEEIVSEELGEDGRISTLGGAIYNYGNVKFYGGNFEYNEGARGGVIYNYRVSKVYGGTFTGNHATLYGGAIYGIDSVYSLTYIGSETGENKVFFIDNTSQKSGGALYCASLAAVVIYGDTVFEGNRALNGSGGAIYTKGVVTAKNVSFTDNYAYSRGGAAYVSSSNAERTTRIVTFENCVMNNNTATTGGAVAVYSSSSTLPEGGKLRVVDCVFDSNTAPNRVGTKATAAGYGGAMFISFKSDVDVKNSSFTNNLAGTEGGAVYMARESTLDITDSVFTSNSALTDTKGYGGAISIHSSYLNTTNTDFAQNEAVRGGAIYISYNSAVLVNSVAKIVDCAFDNNYSELYGGAVCCTRQTIEGDTSENLIVKNSSFTENICASKGGALYFSNGAVAYLKDVSFTKNSVPENVSGHNGGAIYSTGSIIEINGAEFTENSAGANGGALGLYASSVATLNNITAAGNSAGSSAGFALCDTVEFNLYNSTVKNNSAAVNGGAVSMVDLSVSNIYNTTFDGNTAGSDAGALYVYTGDSKTQMFNCAFLNNTSARNGGAIYVSKASKLDMYNTTATGNSAAKGGFMYETTTDTTVLLNGITVSGNTATDGGPIIWGNTTKAIMYLNKASYVDSDVSGTLDDSYFDSAIANSLTVNETSDAIPDYTDYTDTHKETADTVKTGTSVSVDKIFALAESSSDADINTNYAKLEKLDNSSNFMSQNVTKFENINGSTVSVDTFVYLAGEKANNPNVGEGLLIYQAMLYKKEHPEEDVNISLSTFRYTTETAVCINRNSRYFGYMRNVNGADYDKYGFVRISALLVAAAKMGINVTVVGQIDGYPTSSNFCDYFESQLNNSCDTNYVSDGKIGDYLNFKKCYWTSYGDKDATDMMHTKLCAVSHYIDMNGEEHKNAVWTSSSNLDGVNSSATNGNSKLQTATIVSDHAELYRIAANYLDLVSQYCEQEDIYLFRELAIQRSTEQIDLILAGREKEIPTDEQIVYLGSESDDVFELYFAPLGGDSSVWTEKYNPFCKYLRKMNDSDDYVMLTWNNVKFVEYSLSSQIEDMIILAFHENRDVNNRIYVNLDSFNSAAFADLAVGEDIGVKSFNKYEFGALHNKDLQISYSEDGQRYYVSLLNSCNVHGGSMAYQSNFALVIKEKELTEDSVFFTLADLTTTGIVDHSYGEELSKAPENGEHGYTYQECTECGKIIVTGDVHPCAEWITEIAATADSNGIQYKQCTICAEVIEVREVTEDLTVVNYINYSDEGGIAFANEAEAKAIETLAATPHTFEVAFNLPTTYAARAGVLVGNYEGTATDGINLEIYNAGKPRFYYKVGRIGYTCLFKTDVRSDSVTHIAVTIDGLNVNLYVNGELKETSTLTIAIPDTSEGYFIGNDRRTVNAAYFKGTIYAVNLFSDVRTAEEIASDVKLVPGDADNLLYSEYFIESEIPEPEPEPEPEIVVGDVDGDGRVSMSDALTVLKAVANRTDIDNADMNGDGMVTLLDVLRIMKSIIK